MGPRVVEDPYGSVNEAALADWHHLVVAAVNHDDPLTLEDGLGDPVMLRDLVGLAPKERFHCAAPHVDCCGRAKVNDGGLGDRCVRTNDRIRSGVAGSQEMSTASPECKMTTG